MKKYTKKQQKYIDELHATIDKLVSKISTQVEVIDALEDLVLTVPIVAMELVHAATENELLQSENEELRVVVKALAELV